MVPKLKLQLRQLLSLASTLVDVNADTFLFNYDLSLSTRTFFLFQLTIQDVDPHAGRVRIRRSARVSPRIRLHGLLDEEPAGGGGALLRDQTDAAPGRVEVDDLGVVGPDHGRRRLRRVPHQAGEVDGRAHVDEEIWPAQNFRDRFWN